MGFRTKGFYAFAVALASSALALMTWAGPVASAFSADALIPAFELPFGCGERWFAATYVGHPSNAVDWNLGGAGESDFGAAVLAGATGTAHIVADAGYGLQVLVDHGHGWQSRYAHLSAVDIADGARVTARTVVGRVGHSGKATGSHLHHEQLRDGVRQPIVAHGVGVTASYSTRGASYASTNCAAGPSPAPVVVPVAAPVAVPVVALPPAPSVAAPVPAAKSETRLAALSRPSHSELAPGVLGSRAAAAT
jgi:murein DD-endopeptidase MepM/ murein hydrolase activator NlpD